jgi:hypothetical protein
VCRSIDDVFSDESKRSQIESSLPWKSPNYQVDAGKVIREYDGWVGGLEAETETTEFG